MESVDVKILATVITRMYGALSTGDLLRTNPEFARHLVQDCAAAEYVTPPATETNEPKKPRSR